MDRYKHIGSNIEFLIPVRNIRNELYEIFSLSYLGDVLGGVIDMSCEDLNEVISYSNDIKPEFSFLKPEIKEKNVLVNNKQKISFLNELIGKQIQSIKFEVDGQKCEYFEVYIDRVSSYRNECQDNNLDEDMFDDEEDVSDDSSVYIRPTYRLIDGRTLDENPDRMYYQTFLDDIKNIVTDNKEYVFLG